MSELSNNSDNVLSNFPPPLRKNIEELCLRSTIGFLPIHLEDISISANKCILEEDYLNNFHFIFKVPYAGKKLMWEVIFDPEDVYFPPNFDFNDDEFMMWPDVEELSDNVPSYKNWNLKNPKALAEVFNEFLVLYKKHQIEKLQLENIFSRYSEEYKTLIGDGAGIEPENVQLSIEGNNIVFFVSLKLDDILLPDYIQPTPSKGGNLTGITLYNQGDDFCHLKIIVSRLDGSRSNYSIHLSTRLEQILGNKLFPNTFFKKDTPVIDIVTSISRHVNNKLKEIADHHRLKKTYITTLAAVCFKQIIEYDVGAFNKTVFMYNIDDYNCLITVTMGAKFPHEKPTVMLSSLYCPEPKSCNMILDTYPYSPIKKPELNIEHLMEFLHDAVQEFKTHKH